MIQSNAENLWLQMKLLRQKIVLEIEKITVRLRMVWILWNYKGQKNKIISLVLLNHQIFQQFHVLNMDKKIILSNHTGYLYHKMISISKILIKLAKKRKVFCLLSVIKNYWMSQVLLLNINFSQKSDQNSSKDK